MLFNVGEYVALQPAVALEKTRQVIVKLDHTVMIKISEARMSGMPLPPWIQKLDLQDDPSQAYKTYRSLPNNRLLLVTYSLPEDAPSVFRALDRLLVMLGGVQMATNPTAGRVSG
jgi:hypothetical protein